MMIHSLPARRAVPAHRASRQPSWQTSVVALAAALLLGSAAGDARALALGRITVQSALGEPLRAEVELPQVSPEELATLKASVASPQVFQAAGVEYNRLLEGAQIVLQRRADGSPYLRVTSDRAINEPFLDLILEANWASGRIVRDFTMLFDPPRTREPAAPLAAQVPAPAAAQPRTEPAVRPGAGSSIVPPTASAAPANRSNRATGSRARPRPQAAVASGPAPSAPAQGKEQVTVQPGQTAGSIAAAHLPPTVSLDQMLVALLQGNPGAFVGGNVNRLRSGAVLEVPSAEQAAAVPRGQARETLVAQSRDFNQFRRHLAEQPGTAPQSAQAGRSASGRVQAQVEEKSSTPPAPDKLTLSKGALLGRRGDSRGAEEGIARERAAQDRATRMAELDKNIAELNRLNAAAGVPSAPTTNPGAPASGTARAPAGAGIAATPPVLPASSTAVAAAPAASVPASGPAASASGPASSMAQAASAPAPVAASAASSPTASAPVARASAPRKPVAVPALPEQPGMLEQLSENPLIPAGIGALVAALLGWGLYRMRQQRKTAQQVDSSFLESRIQHDSFFGASGGQRIDTAEGSTGVTGTSMVYSPSQLDAAGDVDPVAEADVYLAYGRDLQAEEILKEALRTNPQRIAIHSKLLEIYARRRDAKAFELVASEARALTHGTGTEWNHIARMGQEIDPQNPLYQTEGLPPARAALTAAAAAAAVAARASQPRQERDTEALGSPSSMPHDLDLDLDSLQPPSSMPAPLNPHAGEPSHPGDLHELDLDISAFGDEDNEAPPTPSALADSQAAPAHGLPENLPDLELPGNTIDFDLPEDPVALSSPAPASAAPEPAPAPATEEGLMDFDLGGLSLDLPSTPAARTAPEPEPAGDLPDLDFDSTAAATDDAEDPLGTKLALAEEFHSIGDSEGARSLAQEVLAEAKGDLKKRAERLLADIG